MISQADDRIMRCEIGGANRLVRYRELISNRNSPIELCLTDSANWLKKSI